MSAVSKLRLVFLLWTPVFVCTQFLGITPKAHAANRKTPSNQMRRSPLTPDTARELSEEQLRGLQFYLTVVTPQKIKTPKGGLNAIVLERDISETSQVRSSAQLVHEKGRTFERIVFMEGTPGVATGRSGVRIRVSFEPGCDLEFTPGWAWFELNAEKKGASFPYEIDYCGHRYSVAGHYPDLGQHVILDIDQRSHAETTKTERVVPGQQVDTRKKN